MATAAERYKAATSYVHRAIETVRGAHSWFNLPELIASSNKTAPAANELARIEARWQHAASDGERLKIARDAELLADRTEESLPGAPQDRARTNLWKGEVQTSTAATSYGGELASQAALEWNWLKTAAADAGKAGKSIAWTIGGIALAGGALYLVARGVSAGRRRRYE